MPDGKKYCIVCIGNSFRPAWRTASDSAVHLLNLGNSGGLFLTQHEARAALENYLAQERRKALQEAEYKANATQRRKPDRVTTPDCKEYGRCAECGEMRWLYECYYCDEGHLCWECLCEHKEDYHNFG